MVEAAVLPTFLALYVRREAVQGGCVREVLEDQTARGGVMASLDPKKGETWLELLYALDRMVGKHDFHWGNIMWNDEANNGHGQYEDSNGNRLTDEDFHQLFRFCAFQIKRAAELPGDIDLWWSPE